MRARARSGLRRLAAVPEGQGLGPEPRGPGRQSGDLAGPRRQVALALGDPAVGGISRERRRDLPAVRPHLGGDPCRWAPRLFGEDDALTRQVSEGEKAKFPGHQVLAAEGQAERFCGLAVEVGETETYGSFAEFQAKVTGRRSRQLEAGRGRRSIQGGRRQVARLPLERRPARPGRAGATGSGTTGLAHASRLYVPPGAENDPAPSMPGGAAGRSTSRLAARPSAAPSPTTAG